MVAFRRSRDIPGVLDSRVTCQLHKGVPDATSTKRLSNIVTSNHSWIARRLSNLDRWTGDNKTVQDDWGDCWIFLVHISKMVLAKDQILKEKVCVEPKIALMHDRAKFSWNFQRGQGQSCEALEMGVVWTRENIRKNSIKDFMRKVLETGWGETPADNAEMRRERANPKIKAYKHIHEWATRIPTLEWHEFWLILKYQILAIAVLCQLYTTIKLYNPKNKKC